MIALPGWYVENTSKDQIWAMNPKSCGFIREPRPGQPTLGPPQIQRIAYQVEQLCHLPDPAKAPSR